MSAYPPVRFGIPGLVRICKAIAFEAYGTVVDSDDRIIYCTAGQAEYAAKLLAFNMWVTVTLDHNGNVVKVS